MFGRRRRLVRLLTVLGVIMAAAWWVQRMARRAAEAEVVREALLAYARASGYDTIVFGPNTFDETGLGVLDLRTGERVRNLPASLPDVRGTVPSVAADGRTVAYCANGALEVVHIPTGRVVGRFAPPERRVIPDTPAWSPDGRRLAVEVTPPGSIDEWPQEDGGTPIWIVDPETATGTLLVVSEVSRKAQWQHVYWRADGRALYLEWQEYVPGSYSVWRDRRFRTSEVDVATGKVIQEHPVAVRAAAPDGRLVVEDEDGLWLRRTPQGNGTSLAALRGEGRYRLLGNSRYLVYLEQRKLRPSAFFALDTETGAKAELAHFDMGLPAGFDLARRRPTAQNREDIDNR